LCAPNHRRRTDSCGRQRRDESTIETDDATLRPFVDEGFARPSNEQANDGECKYPPPTGAEASAAKTACQHAHENSRTYKPRWIAGEWRNNECGNAEGERRQNE
jgi:hypothetical protein